MSIRMRPDEDHEVLGSEFCADYQDRFGKWNPGFHCPSEDGSPDVYCCGTDTYKYCCTKKEVLHPSDIPDLAIVLGILCGTIFALTLITILSCFFCSCCFLYKRRHPTVNGGPLYQMHCSSTASGVANMYSFSNQNSSATTPIDTNGASPLVDLDYVTGVVVVVGGGGGTDTGCTTPPPPPPLHRTPNSFATVDLIPSSAKMDRDHDRESCDDHRSAIRMIEKRSTRVENNDNDHNEDEDAPPPYEASTAAIAQETPDVQPSPKNITNEMPHDQIVQTAETAAPGSPTTTDGNQPDETNSTPANDETQLYWSTKF